MKKIAQAYMQIEEKLVQYPLVSKMIGMDKEELEEHLMSKNLSQDNLRTIFQSHLDKFDLEYKQKLFDLGESELTDEANIKYDQI